MTVLAFPMDETALHRSLSQMARSARTRSFGCPNPERRAAIKHGYLLALEELERRAGARGSRQCGPDHVRPA